MGSFSFQTFRRDNSEKFKLLTLVGIAVLVVFLLKNQNANSQTIFGRRHG